MMSSEMSERYYQKRYGDEFYILDSSIISEKSFDEKLELEGYKAFEDSLTGEDVVDLLNENEQLKHNNRMLSRKMSEVYTKYRLLKEFSEDTNPNDAVKKVLSELMQITKEYR